eukprot:scaffold9692_cov117-Skeletonema_dohrnii-CCMP3373.AAC.4
MRDGDVMSSVSTVFFIITGESADETTTRDKPPPLFSLSSWLLAVKLLLYLEISFLLICRTVILGFLAEAPPFKDAAYVCGGLLVDNN